jgi:hypothetical protein
MPETDPETGARTLAVTVTAASMAHWTNTYREEMK